MHTLWTIIAGIFKWSWRILNFVRQLAANVLFIIILLLAAGTYALLTEQDAQVSREPGALYVNLSGVVVDQLTRNSPLESLSLQLLGASSGQLQENSLFDVVETIRTAATDPDITGMILKLDDFVGADQPSLQYIAKPLLNSANRVSGFTPSAATITNLNIIWPLMQTRYTCRRRAASVSTALPPIRCIITNCWKC